MNDGGHYAKMSSEGAVKWIKIGVGMLTVIAMLQVAMIVSLLLAVNAVSNPGTHSILNPDIASKLLTNSISNLVPSITQSNIASAIGALGKFSEKVNADGKQVSKLAHSMGCQSKLDCERSILKQDFLGFMNNVEALIIGVSGGFPETPPVPAFPSSPTTDHPSDIWATAGNTLDWALRQLDPELWKGNAKACVAAVAVMAQRRWVIPAYYQYNCNYWPNYYCEWQRQEEQDFSESAVNILNEIGDVCTAIANGPAKTEL